VKEEDTGLGGGGERRGRRRDKEEEVEATQEGVALGLRL
jgi:hypothetical protein